jgi:hypothetical protein
MDFAMHALLQKNTEGILLCMHCCRRMQKAFCYACTAAEEYRRHFAMHALLQKNTEGILLCMHCCRRTQKAFSYPEDPGEGCALVTTQYWKLILF